VVSRQNADIVDTSCN